ncbi:S1C family serine protease [Planctomycetaceae bacterium SH139]
MFDAHKNNEFTSHSLDLVRLDAAAKRPVPQEMHLNPRQQSDQLPLDEEQLDEEPVNEEPVNEEQFVEQPFDEQPFGFSSLAVAPPPGRDDKAPEATRGRAGGTAKTTVTDKTATDKTAAINRRTAQPASPFTQAMVTLGLLAVTLAVARFLVPSIVEESRYAWRRGELRAEYQSSDEGLQTIGLDRLATAYQMVTQRVGPSVVHIEVEREATASEQVINALRQGGPQAMISDQGSGVIVETDGQIGYVLTNHHVIADGSNIGVGLSDGRRLKAEIVGSDPATDVALLKIKAKGLMPVEWGDSDQAEVGTPVWAVGSPFGLDRTITFGILSGKNRAAKAWGTKYQDFMQSDVAVNPGNSGGPLVDSRGRLIGINTAILGDTYRGVSFSVPSNVAHRVYDRLRATGHFERGWLGVQLAEVPDAMVPSGNLRIRGAMVSHLAEVDSPAALAGLTAGDIIVRFDGEEVADMGALMRMVGNWPAGERAVIDVVRDGTVQSLDVEIGARPKRYGF